MPKSLSVPRTSLYYNLEVSARRYPDKAAIVYYGTTLTYAALEREVAALAGYLQQRCGVGRGDRVLLYAQNSPQFIIGYYAILRADGVVVPVNPMNKSEELAHYIGDSDARVAIAAQELYAEIEPHLAKGGIEHCVLAAYSDYLRETTDLKLPDFVRAPRIDPERAGGDAVVRRPGRGLRRARRARRVRTTSRCCPTRPAPRRCPRAACSRIRTCSSTSTGGCAWSPTSSEAVRLGVLPMFHVTGMQANMNIPIQLGATTVLMTRWDRDTAAELIQRHRVTGVIGITTMIVDFLANPDLGKYDLSSIVRIGGGGASMPEAVAAQDRADARHAVPRRLRPDRDHRAFARQSGAPAEAPVRRHSVFRHRLARHRPGDASRNWGRTKWARSSPTARRCSAATGSRTRRPRTPSSSTTARSSSAPATSATTTRRATSSSPTA